MLILYKPPDRGNGGNIRGAHENGKPSVRHQKRGFVEGKIPFEVEFKAIGA